MPTVTQKDLDKLYKSMKNIPDAMVTLYTSQDIATASTVLSLGFLAYIAQVLTDIREVITKQQSKV